MSRALKIGALAALTIGLQGCFKKASPEDAGTPADAGKGDAGTCAAPCGSDCCTGNTVCDANKKCVQKCQPNCGGKSCGADGCGGTCGSCGAGTKCDDNLGTCRPCQTTCSSGGKVCGEDGCGGTCGTCPAGQACDAAGKCGACQPNCGGKICGDNGCGGSCGQCAMGSTCTTAGQCSVCTPSCTTMDGKTKQCGDNGCGGTCGTCPTGHTCDAQSQCATCPAQCARAACSPTCSGACGACPSGETCLPSGVCQSPCNCNGRQCGPNSCGTGTCGTCPGGMSCNTQGQCTGCTPSCRGRACGPDGCGGLCGTCPAGQPCDSSTGQCTAACNPPCPAGQACDGATLTCKSSTTCGGTTCGLGQGCYDPLTMLPGGSTCTCLPERGDPQSPTPDTCAPFGKTCDLNPDSPGAATCRLPRNKEDCTVSVGCAPGQDCVKLSAGNVCVQKCTTGGDCDNTLDSCISGTGSAVDNHCFWNICAQPEQTPSDRSKYFQPCNSSGTGDGFCVPLRTVNAAQTAYVDIGVCFFAGTAPSKGKCVPGSDRKSPSGICPSNEYCRRVKSTEGVCTPLCNAASTPNPTKTCAGSNTLCQDVSGVQQAGMMTSARLGFCQTKCNALGTDVCSSDVLGNTQGCFPAPPYDGAGYCTPLSPTTAAAGGGCSFTPGDSRSPCADRTYCQVPQGSTTGTCAGFCDTAVCSSPNAPCTSCAPSGTKCQPAGSGAKLGVCGP